MQLLKSMDYTDDVCMYEFTSGQALRANSAWDSFRANTPSTCIDSPYKAIMKMAGDGSKILLSCDAIDISLDAAKTFCEPDGRLATHCPSSCKQCDIGGYNVDSKAQFLYEAVTGPAKLRSCKWLNRLTPERRERHCTKNEKLRMTCRDSCKSSDN